MFTVIEPVLIARGTDTMNYNIQRGLAINHYQSVICARAISASDISLLKGCASSIASKLRAVLGLLSNLLHLELSDSKEHRHW